MFSNLSSANVFLGNPLDFSSAVAFNLDKLKFVSSVQELRMKGLGEIS